MNLDIQHVTIPGESLDCGIKMIKRINRVMRYASWIFLILLVFLLSACIPSEIERVGTEQTQDSTLNHLQSPQPSQSPEPASPSATSTALTIPTVIPSSSSLIPHFPPGERLSITSIGMIDTKTGWAIGRTEDSIADHIFTTVDGGNNWLDVTPPETLPQKANEFTYKQAFGFFMDGTNAWVIYNPNELGQPAIVWMTASGGILWEASDPINTLFQTIDRLYFSNESHGWLMLGIEGGMGHAWVELYRTSEIGGQWELLIDPQNDDDSADLHYCCKTGMVFYGLDTGLVTFGRGPMGGAFINWTDDGGWTWESHSLPRPAGAFKELDDSEFGILCESHSPVLFSSQLGRVALECWSNLEKADLLSFIYTTQDGGETWNSESYPGGQLLFLNPLVGWALSMEIYQTLDGGESWNLMSTVDWDGQFSFVSEDQGWAVAHNDEELALVHTSDGGKTWDLINPYSR